MSDTINLACLTCHVELWVGQGGYPPNPKRAYLYGTEEHRAKFEAFYHEHAAHDLECCWQKCGGALSVIGTATWTTGCCPTARAGL
jgi:hypothetical protein